MLLGGCCCNPQGCSIFTTTFPDDADPPADFTEIEGTAWETTGGELRTSESDAILFCDTTNTDDGNGVVTTGIKLPLGGEAKILINVTDEDNHHYALVRRDPSETDLSRVELHEVASGADTTLRKFSNIFWQDGSFNEFTVWFGNNTFACLNTGLGLPHSGEINGGWVEVADGSGDKAGLGTGTIPTGYAEFSAFIYEKHKITGDSDTSACPGYNRQCAIDTSCDNEVGYVLIAAGTVTDSGRCSVDLASDSSVTYDGGLPTTLTGIKILTVATTDEGDTARLHINSDTYLEYTHGIDDAGEIGELSGEAKVFVGGSLQGSAVKMAPQSFGLAVICFDGSTLTASINGLVVFQGSASISTFEPAFSTGTVGSTVNIDGLAITMHPTDLPGCSPCPTTCASASVFAEHIKVTLNGPLAYASGGNRCTDDAACTGLDGIENICETTGGCNWKFHGDLPTDCVVVTGGHTFTFYEIRVSFSSSTEIKVELFFGPGFAAATARAGQAIITVGSLPNMETLSVSSSVGDFEGFPFTPIFDDTDLCDFYSAMTIDVEGITE